VLLKRRELSVDLLSSIVPLVVRILVILEQYFISIGINAPLSIKWDDDNQKLLLDRSAEVHHFLTILLIVLPDAIVSDDDWTIGSRDIAFRLLVD
jgi:hypothetical protein